MKKQRVWRIFLINLSLVIVIFLTGILLGFIFRTNQIIHNQIVVTARSHFQNIVLARRWNAQYGGVFVEKAAGIESNPYLENPDIYTVDGKVYTMKNPALMTREISVFAEKAQDFRYHITSLRPLNPDNYANDFETAALLSFESGVKESFETIEKNGRTVFQYMAPLFVEASCLKCHAKQGYKKGEVRGGISVALDVTDIYTQMRANTLIASGLTAAISLSLLSMIWFLVSRLARRLTTAYETIEVMSITDELTRLHNRRHFETRLEEEISRSLRYNSPISLMILDIDHFKKVNDNYGHQAGDWVLTQFAALLKDNVRKADVPARWGGEEFAVILTESTVSQARMAAEKVRRNVESSEFNIPDGRSIPVTVSVGVASLDMISGDEVGNEADVLVKTADDALYRAKQEGRNRTVVASDQAK